MKRVIGAVAAVIMLSACGGRRLSPQELEQKLDSIRKLEVKERLEAQGINLDKSDNPFKQFYDSLALLPLPISYSEEFVRYQPNFKPVPTNISKALELEGTDKQKAIALPETLGARLMILAADEPGDLYSLWLYSLDDDCMPVDKLCLYAIDDEIDIYEFGKEEYVQYFSITSDYEIHLMDYSREEHRTCTEEVYTLDAARNFCLQKSEEIY